MESKKTFKSLYKSSDYLFLKKQGKRLTPAPWVTFYYLINESKEIRAGWTASRFIGNAVIRNKMKRWSREYFRSLVQNRDIKIGIDINVVFKSTQKDLFKKISHQEFIQVFDQFFKRIIK